MIESTPAEPHTSCPPHHWMISDPVNRTEQWQCLRCGAERTLEKARTHLTRLCRGQTPPQLVNSAERAT
jgi:hypothetical protein